MSESDDEAVDPRYDKAFQRGFEGEVATGPRGQSTLRRTAAVNPAPARQAAPPLDGSQSRDDAQKREVAGPRDTARRDETLAAPSLAVAPEVSGSTASVSASPITVATPRELVRNPFVIALAVLGAVLILTGVIWAYEGFATIVKNGGTRNEVEFWAAQTMSFGAPLSIVIGLGVAAVLLVMFSRSWQRSRA